MFQRILLIVAALIGSFAMPSIAQDFPKKQPIKIVVPVPAGGATDTLARITAEYLSKRLGQVVIVDNRPGAASTIGANLVAKSPADGYTLLFMGAEFSVTPAVKKDVPYKLEDFTYLVRPFNLPPVLLASPKYPASTIQELVADIKAKPGMMKYGSTGTGAIIHMGMTMFEDSTGSKLLHVPYQGIAPVYQALRSGDVDFSASSPPFPEGFKPLASMGSTRSPAYPMLPTLRELGIQAGWEGWFGFMAPGNMPKPITDRLITEILAVLKDPDAIVKYKGANAAPEAQPLTGDVYRQSVLEENKRWKAIADKAKIVID